MRPDPPRGSDEPVRGDQVSDAAQALVDRFVDQCTIRRICEKRRINIGICYRIDLGFDLVQISKRRLRPLHVALEPQRTGERLMHIQKSVNFPARALISVSRASPGPLPSQPMTETVKLSTISSRE